MTQRFNPAKNAFVAGELSPRLEGRDNLDQYHQGMRQALNGIVLPHGGFMRRSGTRFVSEVKNSSDRVRLIPFVFGTTAAYVVEAGDQYLRFYVNEGQLVDGGGSPVEVSTPYSPDDLPDLQWAQSADVMWLVHPDHHPYKLQRTSATSFTLTRETWSGATNTGGRGPLRAVNNDPGNSLEVTGSGPYTLTWDSDPVPGGLDGTFDDKRIVRHDDGTNEAWYEITGVSSATVATATLEFGSASTAMGGSTNWAVGMFSEAEGARAVAFHEGRLWYGGSQVELDRIVGSVSDDFNNFDLRDPSGTSAENADRSISRRATGSSAGQVNAVQWLASAREALHIGTTGTLASLRGENNDTITPLGAILRATANIGSTHDMPVVVNNTPIFLQRSGRRLRELNFNIQSDSQEAREISIFAEHILRGGGEEMTYQQSPEGIVWVVRADGTLVGFSRQQEHGVTGAHRHELGGAFQTKRAEVESVAAIPTVGSDDVDQLWLAVKRTIGGSTKRYVEFVENYFDPDVTPASPKSERVAALEEAFFVDSGLSLDNPRGGGITGVTNASPAVVTTSSAHGLSNGDRVRLRGIVGGLDASGEDTLGDRLNHTSFLAANQTSTTFELQDRDGNDVDTSGDTSYVAGGSVREEVQSVSGLSHLEGEEVQVFVDGALHPDKTVSSGSVSLDRHGSVVQVGLGYDTVGETQRFFGGGRLGGDQGQQMRIQRIVARLHNTLGIELGVGPTPEELETPSGGLAEPLFRQGDDTFDQSPPMFVTGDVEVGVPGGWTREPTAYFKQDRPLPMTVLAVYPRMAVGER